LSHCAQAEIGNKKAMATLRIEMRFILTSGTRDFIINAPPMAGIGESVRFLNFGWKLADRFIVGVQATRGHSMASSRDLDPSTQAGL
jgi:hypothetical protein